MPERAAPGKVTAIRGAVLTYTGNPFKSGLEHMMDYECDAIITMADGKITHFGPAERMRPHLPTGIEIKNYGKDSLISAGFIDSHVHFPQTPMIAAYGEQLLDWFNKYTFLPSRNTRTRSSPVPSRRSFFARVSATGYQRPRSTHRRKSRRRG